MKLCLSDMMPNTLNSHRLIHFADKFGKQNEIADLLFRQYWLEGKDIGNLEILDNAAKQVGVQNVR